MLTTKTTTMETVWNTFQEPRCFTGLPNSYLLLLSALDQGWRIARVESKPSWDQHGFIYVVTLKCQSHQRQSQKLILPQNPLIRELLREFQPKTVPSFGGIPKPV